MSSRTSEMKPELSMRPMSRSEKETETEAARLIELIAEALEVVAIGSTEVDSLKAIADRIERAARDLSGALRELAEQRRIDQNAVE